MFMSLEKYRKEIDKIDSKISKLLNQRFKVVKQVGKFKQKNSIKVTDKSRESQVLKKFKKQEIKEVFKTIIKQAKKLQ